MIRDDLKGIIAYQFLLISCIVAISSLNLISFPRATDITDSIITASYTFIILIVYTILFEILRFISPKTWGLKRRTNHSDYSDLPIPTDSEMALEGGRPKLNMNNIWLLVYGLGATYFVINYVCTCRQVMVLVFFMLGVCVVVVDELVHSHSLLFSGPNLLYIACTVLSLIGIVVRGLDSAFVEYFQGSDVFYICFSIIGPLAAGCLLIDVKENKKFAMGSISDLCEFGMPFACILSILLLVCLDGHNHHRVTMDNVSDNYWVLAAPIISPFPLLISLVLILEGIVQNHVVDVLISLTVGSGIMGVLQDTGSQMAILSLLMGVIACIIRLTMFTEFIFKTSKNTNKIQTVFSVTEVSVDE